MRVQGTTPTRPDTPLAGHLQLDPALRRVQRAEHEGDGAVVEVAVGYLRRKTDVAFGRRAIEIVRGVVGHRLAAVGG